MHDSDTTTALAHDISAEGVKAALETLPSINHVDVKRETLANGQCRWTITFRIPQIPSTLQIKTHLISGSLLEANVFVSIPSNPSSLISKIGVDAKVNIEENIAGLPSYTGSYLSDSVGSQFLIFKVVG